MQTAVICANIRRMLHRLAYLKAKLQLCVEKIWSKDYTI
jgi:hypothetical protein